MSDTPVATFTVHDKFPIRGRKPVISRPDAESKAAWAAGERWHTGDIAVCGELEARVVGIERWAIFDANDGALMLDIDIGLLERGQVWVQKR